MRKFELLEQGAKTSVRVTASTKAGLAIAALNGLFAAAVPRVDDDESRLVRHPFEIQADDFPSLLTDLLGKALADAMKAGEMYEDIKFSLVTDTKALGELVGKPVLGFKRKLKKVEAGVKVEKNPEGVWETTIVFGA